MNRDIQIMIDKYPTCQKIRPNLGKVVDTWPKAEPFDRVHMDWAYVKGVGNILIIVDAGSGWIEAFRSENVIKCLRTVFTRFGIPKILVSDNACEFTSTQLNEWIRWQGATKMESPAYFPRANGLAERAVQIQKSAQWLV